MSFFPGDDGKCSHVACQGQSVDLEVRVRLNGTFKDVGFLK